MVPDKLISNGKEETKGLPLQRLDLELSAEVKGSLKEAAQIFEGRENSSSQSNEGVRRETNEKGRLET